MMELGVLDLIVAALVFVHLIRCLRYGTNFALRSFLGFFGGGGIALLVAPWALTKWMDPGTPAGLITMLSAGLVALGAWLGMLLAADSVAAAVTETEETHQRRKPHSPLGLVCGLLSVVLMAGTVTHLAWQSGEARAAKYVSKSPLLTAASAVIPPAAVEWALDVLPHRVQTATGLPVLPLLSNVGELNYQTPDLADVRDGAELAKKSLVKITGIAEACQEGHEGSGFVLADGLVVTNAHVVAGMTEPLVQRGGVGRHHISTVVAFDARSDLAILAVPSLKAPPMTWAESVASGDVVAALGFPMGGPYHVSPGVVVRTTQVRSNDIYGQQRFLRDIVVVGANVRSGNSGGPLITKDGNLAGVIFAKSTDTKDLGYAVTLADLRTLYDRLNTNPQPVPTGDCKAISN